MTITVSAEVAGHVLVLDVRGAKLHLSREEAYEVAHQLAHHLDRLYHDDTVAVQEAKLRNTYVNNSQEAH